MSLKWNNVTAPGEEHYHGNVKCYSKSCIKPDINTADRIVRDPNLIQAPVPTNWRDQTDHLRNEVFEKCLGYELGPESEGYKDK